MFYVILHLILLILILAVQPLKLSVEFKWTHLNYTWGSRLDYEYAIHAKTYIATNNIPTDIKIFGNDIYIALGNLALGAPVTLAVLKKKSQLLAPFPSWEMNMKCNCSALQYVHCLEIDTKGLMWIVDGIRNGDDAKNCPAKLLLYDLKLRKVASKFVFPEELSNGALMKAIVLDGSNAYIADSSPYDPGLIVYSRTRNKAWKLRDASMFPNITSGSAMFGFSGLALSPRRSSISTKYIYYSQIDSHALYCLKSSILLDEEFVKTNASWRKYVIQVATKVDQSTAMTMDGLGNLYFNLYDRRALAKWSVYQNFNKARIAHVDKTLLDGIVSFAFNTDGNLFALQNVYVRDLTSKQVADDNIRFRIVKFDTTARSYLYGKKKNES